MPRIKIDQDQKTLTFEIFDLVRLIQNEVVPSFPPKYFLILYHQFIRSYANIKKVDFRPPRSFLFSLSICPVIRQTIKRRQPPFKFYFPVHYDARGTDDQVGP
jgi:hypothetical protein